MSTYLNSSPNKPAKWDVHEKRASKRSKRWAVSDRGWLFHGCGTALGHYLDYGANPHDGTPRSPQGNVHAIAIRHTPRKLPDGRTVCECTTVGSAYHATPAAAMAWIEEQIK
jgi:hypothetical protein